MDLPQYSPQKEWRSNGGADPSFPSCTVRIPPRRNLRWKMKAYFLPGYRVLNHNRWRRQKLTWSQKPIQNRTSTNRGKSCICPVTQLRVKELPPAKLGPNKYSGREAPEEEQKHPLSQRRTWQLGGLVEEAQTEQEKYDEAE